MATIAEFTVASEAFPLGHLFERIPAITIELDRVVPTNDALIPYVWIRNGNFEDIVAAVESHQDLRSMRLVDQADGIGLFRVEWDPDVKGIITCIVETDVALLSGTGTRGEWVFEVRADSAVTISEFQQCCRNYDIDVTLSRLHTVTETDTRGRYNVTPEQQEALLLAFDEGYYDEPREVSLETMAGQLGISRPSLSARLKRGYRNLIRSTLVHRQDEPP
jgi:predicted DNA binding protein